MVFRNHSLNFRITTFRKAQLIMKPFIFLLFVIAANSLVVAQQTRTLFCYFSTDGTTFTDSAWVQDSADVPSMVIDSNGTIWCTYQNFKGGSSEKDKIGIKTSSDGGYTWSSRTIASFTGYPGTSQRPFDPTIRILGNGGFRMFFSYCPNGTGTMLDSTCDTYSATSSDGYNYVFDTLPRFGVAGKEVIDPTIVWFDSAWHYCAPSGAPQDGAYYARSLNGLNFVLLDTTSSDASHNWTGNLMDNDSDMRFYGYVPPAPGTIWWASSTDGLSWSSFNNTNVTGKDPAITKTDSGSYLMVVPLDTVILAGIADDGLDVIDVYPNPTSGQITFWASRSYIESWQLLSLQGAVMMQGDKGDSYDKTRNCYILDIADLASGSYFIRIQTSEGTFTRKVQKW